MSRNAKYFNASWLGIYREEKHPELQRANPGNSRGRHVSQLVCGVPCLECAKGVHLTEGAEQSGESTEYRQVSLPSTFGVLVSTATQLGAPILGMCGGVVGHTMVDDPGFVRAHGRFFVKVETYSWRSVGEFLVVRHGKERAGL